MSPSYPPINQRSSQKSIHVHTDFSTEYSGTLLSILRLILKGSYKMHGESLGIRTAYESPTFFEVTSALISRFHKYQINNLSSFGNIGYAISSRPYRMISSSQQDSHVYGLFYRLSRPILLPNIEKV